MDYGHHNLRLRENAQIRRIGREMAERKAAAVLTPEDLEFLTMSAEDPCHMCCMVHCMGYQADAVRALGGEVGDCCGQPCIDPGWIFEQQKSEPDAD
jgi:hypothetical protein